MNALKRAVLSFSLAAAVAAPAAFLAPPAALAESALQYRQAILQDLDPSSADRLLKSDADRAAVRAALPADSTAIFRQAAELKDLMDMLGAHSDAATLRRALTARPAPSELFTQPAKLLGWTQRHAGASYDLVRAVVWDWDKLTREQAAWLSPQVTRQAWEAMTLPKRHEHMRRWGQAIHERLMKAAPKTQAEVDRMRQEYAAVRGAISHDEAVDISRRLTMASRSITALGDVQSRLSKLQDPALKTMLDQARNARDMETTLSTLSKIYDRMGVANGSLKAVAPAEAGQTLDAGSRSTLAKALGPALMRQVRGTTAGDDLAEFYKTHELKIAVAPRKAIATYDDGTRTITFSEELILELVKGEGLTVSQFLSRGDAFGRAAALLAPVFTHEATHQMQSEWARAQKISDQSGQHRELEAMMVEALFTNEKMAVDPGFKAVTEGAADRSLLAAESLSLAESLRKNRTLFRNKIIADHYPELNSLEANLWCGITFNLMLVKELQDEITRRRRLPIAEQGRLARGPPFPKPGMTQAEWSQALRKVGTPFLEDQVKRQRETAGAKAEDYDKSRDRLAQADRKVAQAMQDLAQGKRPGRKASGVPPP
ncbi:MAG: hypothetical protein HY927_07055 [Elusimicrobia bacterium]|nr:hypothetical protein [Elusimicrobiota bacterium]